MTVDLALGHWSTQYSDTKDQKRNDAKKVFSQGWDIIGITEASKSDDGKATRDAIRDVAPDYGYATWFNDGDTGIAVRLACVGGNGQVTEGYQKVINKRTGDKPHGERGIAWVRFAHKSVGMIRFACVHYVTKGTPNSENDNKRYAREIGDWAQKMGRNDADGNRIAFVSGDFNRNDEDVDLVWGEPLTSCWDDMGKWPSTHQGNSDTIDAILRFDGDKDRVSKAAAAHRYEDSELKLAGDHYPIRAIYHVS